MYRKWQEEHDRDPNTTPLNVWIKTAMDNDENNAYSLEDRDRLMLTRKPLQKAIRYSRMMAFGNHYRVDDEANLQLETYDCGVAAVFQVSAPNQQDMSVHYVGVLKDILKLDYGSLSNPIVLMRCEWVKRTDNRGNPTYIRDEAGFLVVNFHHKMRRMFDPFIFSNQATQVFFCQ